MLLELLYISNVQTLSVSVVPMNFEVGLRAPLATALILPCSRVYIKRSLSASPSDLLPRMIPFVLMCFLIILLSLWGVLGSCERRGCWSIPPV